MTIAAFPPAFSMSASVCISGSLLWPLRTTLAPNAENAMAVAWPMPFPAPVTMATRSEKNCVCMSEHYGQRGGG